MTKKMMTTSLVIGSMFTLIGCGGGGSSTATSSVATGTAYYVDSAVEGVDYTCGARSGVTGADGAFTFEAGGSCTFYLGDIELRSVEARLLADGNKVYETDVRIARILQSLDKDRTPSNGIQVSSSIIEKLAAVGITKLLEIEDMLQAIYSAGGSYVTREEAIEHMLNTFLVGNTLYQHCKDGVVASTFEKDGTIDGTPYSIEGDSVYTDEGFYKEEHIFVEATADHLKFKESNGEVTTFYFTEAAAEASPAIECN